MVYVGGRGSPTRLDNGFRRLFKYDPPIETEVKISPVRKGTVGDMLYLDMYMLNIVVQLGMPVFGIKKIIMHPSSFVWGIYIFCIINLDKLTALASF